MKTEAPTEGLALEDFVGRAAEEYAQRVKAGDRPDVEEFARKYPEAADIIRQVLPSLVLLEAGMTEESITSESARSSTNGVLGDYRLIREVGRGGMGVVYEAEQLSLSRRVALKVLPFAAMLDERQIKRFHNEARAAAQLKHPNIVQVFGVGCERGVHLYAMEYVEGVSLAEAITELRGDQEAFSRPSEACSSNRPSSSTAAAFGLDSREAVGRRKEFFRGAARLGAQVADALDHAHSEGIVHRDIKPSNLMIDQSSKVWVTDFGLARIESSPNLTITGDLLGTLRYMSPEQILAKRVVIDHRTDIYSLGASLYELLTLRPAFPEEDRQELTRQIAFDEPQRPRSIFKDIPLDLETVVLTAMAKNPQERYQSGREMAADIRRYLSDEPLVARRPGAATQVAKWMRRNLRVVTYAAAALALALVTGFAVMIASQNRLRAANEQLENTVVELEVERDRATTAKANAELAAVDARSASAFLKRLLNSADAYLASEFETAALERMLDASVSRLEKGGFSNVSIRSELRTCLAQAYAALGRIAESKKLFDKAIRESKEQLGLEHEVTLASRSARIASAVEHYPSDELVPTLADIEECMGLHHLTFGATDRRTLSMMRLRGLALQKLARFEEARAQLYEIIRLAPKDDWQSTDMGIQTYMQLADVEADLQNFEKTTSICESQLPQVVAMRPDADLSRQRFTSFVAAVAGHEKTPNECRKRLHRLLDSVINDPIPLCPLLAGNFNLFADRSYSAGDIESAIDLKKWLFYSHLRYSRMPTVSSYVEAVNALSAWNPPEPQPSAGLYFEKEEDAVLVPNLFFDGQPPFTWEAFARLDGSVKRRYANWASIVSTTNSGGASLEIDSDFPQATVANVTKAKNQWRYNYAIAQSPSIVELHRMYHFAAVWGDGVLRIYVDGELQAEQLVADRCSRITGFPLCIGADPAGDQYRFTEGTFLGLIQQVRISDSIEYDESFTPTQNLTTTPGTVALYDFRRNTGKYAEDLSGNGNHGVILGAEWMEANHQ